MGFSTSMLSKDFSRKLLYSPYFRLFRPKKHLQVVFKMGKSTRRRVGVV